MEGSENRQSKVVYAVATEEDAASSSDIDPFKIMDLVNSSDDEGLEGLSKCRSVFRAHEPPLSMVEPDGRRIISIMVACLVPGRVTGLSALSISSAASRILRGCPLRVGL